MLPTFLSASSLSVTDLVISLTGFVLLYTALIVVMVFLMVRSIKIGPPDTTTAVRRPQLVGGGGGSLVPQPMAKHSND